MLEDLFVRPYTTAPWIKEKYQVENGQMFDKIQSVCYKNNTFPLFLRGQGARRFLTASAF